MIMEKKVQPRLSKFFTPSGKSSGRSNYVTDEEFLKSRKSTSNKRKVSNIDNSSPNTSIKKPKTQDLDKSEEVSLIDFREDISNNETEPGCQRSSTAHKNIGLSANTSQKLKSFAASESNGSEIREIRKPRNVPDISDKLGADVNGECCEEADAETVSPGSSNSRPSVATKLNQFSNSKVKSSSNSNKRSKYTPLEQQFLEIKRDHEDTVLFVECGYKYRFFGDDAEIAAKVLKIFCHMDHNFMTASIPTHRLFVHVRRLVSAGYKVGVVKQVETAALKAAGDNRNTPFTRKLSALYTKSTLIGEEHVDGTSASEGGDDTDCNTTSNSDSDSTGHLKPNNYLMCIYDGLSEDSKHNTNISIVAIDPATGDVIYDEFVDNEMRGELETRLTHLSPVELLLPETLSTASHRLIQDVVALSSTDDDRIRIERLKDEHFTQEKSNRIISDFLKNDNENILQEMLNLPKPVLRCMSALIVYLQDFNLHNILKVTGNINRFSVRSKFMQLSGSTLRNLEIFCNSSDGSEKGCLLWVLNHTVTKYGNRLLRNWISKPLLDISEIEKRQSAINLILSSSSQSLEKLKNLLRKSPDLEKALGSIFHRKCSVWEFFNVVKSLERICEAVKEMNVDAGMFKGSTLLMAIMEEVPDLLHDITDFRQSLVEQAARENDKTNLFVNQANFPDIVEKKEEILEVMKGIREHRKEIRLLLKQPSFDYSVVSQIEFLIEVKNNLVKDVPADWMMINSTKSVTRFHSPFIVNEMKKLAQLKEQLVAAANEAWQSFLQDFARNFGLYRKAIQHLASLDCLLSLATVAKQDGFCRPEFVRDGCCVDIVNGCHPVITSLLSGQQQQYVPNDTHLQAERVMIITGPNMGGKSSYIRQVGLLCIMAQIGSYIPAERARLSVIDAIYTRMGAGDEIFQGRSTFMVELQEASEIMKEATSQSLVILDELGRGTSTHDGLAIAHATLKYFIEEVKSFTLFVTHYPSLGDLELSFPGIVGNYHMSFLLHDTGNGEADSITFLYQLVKGQAAKSYGLNVARLAHIDPSVIEVAQHKSQQMENSIVLHRRNLKIFSEIMKSSEINIKDNIDKLFHCKNKMS